MRIHLLIVFLLFCLCSSGQDVKLDKQFWRTEYSKTLKKALKNPKEAKYVFIQDYSDSIFPNDEVMQLVNVEHIVVFAKTNRYVKDSASFTKPIELRINLNKLKLLSKVKYLRFSEFNFENFPLELCDLTNLEMLNLSYCNIKSLPEEISNLRNLKALILRLDNIKELPSSFGSLKQLIYLDLTNNSFRSFPRVFEQMDGLRFVGLSNLEQSYPLASSRYWNLSFSMYVNRINYLTEISELKITLEHLKDCKMELEIGTNKQRVEIKRQLGDSLYRRTKWRITTDNTFY